ncbi:MAG: UDP-N-acetylmuramate--L-alanine ligase [Chlamydiales bacterium]|nr:UDP-N-acetylmuramate--L-alanine ligase [Chlamydiales bacterium]
MKKKQEKYHFIGIGGIGMSGLARILLAQKKLVSGSDLSLSYGTEELVDRGAVVAKGHSAKHISPNQTVIYSSSIGENNPEYQAAKQLKCRLLHRSEMLFELMGSKKTLAVTGTHGKTSTSALLTSVLLASGEDLTFAIGGMLAGQNGKWGAGEYFVAEADESDGSFLNYFPHGAILTNLEAEHLDHYKTEEALHSAFEIFISQVQDPHLLFYCGDDPHLKANGVSYGFKEGNALRIQNFKQKGWHSQFDLHFEGKVYQEINLNLIGEHNVLNAAAVFGLALRLKIAEHAIRLAFKNFSGVGRRCEKRAQVSNILLLDDYAHHPTEIQTTLRAVKAAAQERRVVTVFQPHKYSRTQDYLREFAHALAEADLVYVTDIYPAGEKPIERIDAQALVRQDSTSKCRYLSSSKVLAELKNTLRPHDVFISLGAGDIFKIHSDLIKDFQPKKYVLGLVFGGESCEHEISLRSARFVAKSLNRDLYDIHYFGIDKQGNWIVGDEAKELLASQEQLVSENASSPLDPNVSRALQQCDLFFPALHGSFGEDGTIQGFFEMLHKPYVGPNHKSASLCMDKILTKRLVEACGVQTPKDISFTRAQWLADKTLAHSLCLPVYVKPVSLGSSIGISFVATKELLEQACAYAFKYDTKVMVEEAKVGCRELEFAVMGNQRVTVPSPGEKLSGGEFVNYEKKYGQAHVQTTIEPNLSPELLEKGKKLAQKAYQALDCSGVTRVDFLLDKEGEFWFFEANSLPGLTPLSLFPKIWEREGVFPTELFDRMVILALEKQRHKQCLSL